MAKILVVDDHRISRVFIAGVLSDCGHHLLEAADGAEALQLCRREQPNFVISDILMPTMDGFEFVRRLRLDPTIAHIAVAFYSSTYLSGDALALANACGVEVMFEKSGDPEVIERAVSKLLQRSTVSTTSIPKSNFQSQHLSLLTDTLANKADDLEQANRQLAEAYDATLEGWVRALDLRDKETEGHTQRVTQMTSHLAQYIACDAKPTDLRRGALLHDIGKIGVPDRILLKPGPLSDEEWNLMRCHPVYALQMLAPISFLQQALDIPYCHHEKWDGTGYPRGLRGEEIPLPARIFAVIDVWDALSFTRPYRDAWPQDRVRAFLREQMGKHFDPEVVKIFFKFELIGKFGKE